MSEGRGRGIDREEEEAVRQVAVAAATNSTFPRPPLLRKGGGAGATRISFLPSLPLGSSWKRSLF